MRAKSVLFALALTFLVGLYTFAGRSRGHADDKPVASEAPNTAGAAGRGFGRVDEIRTVNPNVLMPLKLFPGGHGMGSVCRQPDAPSLVLVKVNGTNEHLACNTANGSWRSHTFPGGVKADHVQPSDDSWAVFNLAGKAITELVAIDRKGNWCTHKLPAAAANCVPVIGSKVAACFVDVDGDDQFEHVVYAFSAETGTWAALETKGPGKDKQQWVSTESDHVLVVEPDSVAVFSAATGKWAVAKTAK